MIDYSEILGYLFLISLPALVIVLFSLKGYYEKRKKIRQFYDSFDKIKEGMSYILVAQIIGYEADKAIPIGDGYFQYTWKIYDDSNGILFASVHHKKLLFKDGKVASRVDR